MNEDFIPSELAAKLKEKGFPLKYKLETKSWSAEYKRVVVLPNIYEVLKWLREEKKIFIEIGLCHDGYFAQIYTDVHWDKDFADEEELFYTSHPRQRIYGNTTPEQAALAGIEYVLNNLI